MNLLSGIVGIACLLAYRFAVYDRIPISDWLASHLLPRFSLDAAQTFPMPE